MNGNNLILFNPNNYIGTYDKSYVNKSSIMDIEYYTYNILKRLFDIVISLIGIILLLPLSVMVKIAYLITGDTNSIFFKQKRIGKNGNEIYIYKFRTMIPNAENILEEMLKNDPKIREEYLRDKKLKNDPRITKFGRIIRKASIDEFPQFINVFFGDMSVVGPRPYLFREKDDMGFYYKYIIKSKPGITGMWQVSGRNKVGFYNRLLLDKQYDEEKSILLDTKIFFKTFGKVLKKEGSS